MFPATGILVVDCHKHDMYLDPDHPTTKDHEHMADWAPYDPRFFSRCLWLENDTL